MCVAKVRYVSLPTKLAKKAHGHMFLDKPSGKAERMDKPSGIAEHFTLKVKRQSRALLFDR
jgi:hypothetical protein